MDDKVVVWQRWAVGARDGEDEARAAAAEARSVAARLRAAGAVSSTTLGGSSIATVEPGDLEDVIDGVLDLLDDADGRGARLAFGVALGPVDGATSVGVAYDRALALAGRGRAGELVFDAVARDAAARVFLFGRPTGAAGALRGWPVDRAFPRRVACTAALAKLGLPALAPSHTSIVARLVDVARAPGAHTLVLRAPAGAGVLSWTRAILEALDRPIVVTLRSVAGGLVPLGSLASALRTLGPPPSAPEPCAAALARIADGRPESDPDARAALSGWLDAAGRRVVFLLDGVAQIDAASLDCVADVAGHPSVLTLARLAVGATAPPFLVGPQIEDIVVPPLRTADAIAVAASVLGEATDEDVVRRVAVLGGDLPVGVHEAARALVACGDLVPGPDGGFTWRVGPRAASQASPTTRWLLDRAALLDESTRRVLEIVSVAPEDAPDALVIRVAEADGVERGADALAKLRAESLLFTGSALPVPQVPLLRRAVIEALPASRTAELHRYVAAALASDDRDARPFGVAARAHHLAEGGRGDEAARLWLDVAQKTAALGHVRAAARLAVASARAATHEPLRSDATALANELRARSARTTDLPRSATLTGEVAAPSPLRAARSAVRAGDFAAVERLLDEAGSTPAAAEPLRAVAQLARGDLEAALRTVQRARRLGESDPRTAARASLTLALLQLQKGSPRDAVRAALGALATARGHGDARGEEAALATLAHCYDALGRDEDAARLRAPR